MKKKMKRTESEIWKIIKKVLGVIFILVGIIGLFLPILQGILLILIGLALFNNENIHKYILRKLKKFKKRKKKVVNKMLG